MNRGSRRKSRNGKSTGFESRRASIRLVRAAVKQLPFPCHCSRTAPADFLGLDGQVLLVLGATSLYSNMTARPRGERVPAPGIGSTAKSKGIT
jgi:hypothetical protein